SGRIYKITYGEPSPAALRDLAKASEHDLVALQDHRNEWFGRMARRRLADRAARGETLRQARGELMAAGKSHADPVRTLRALWSLQVMGVADEELLRSLLEHEHEAVRAWAIRLLTDRMPLDTVFSTRVGSDLEPAAATYAALLRMAREDRSGLVRL